ncbi:hypothetical protein BG58_11060 [Caballeronia jiangsuensis]|nr:hypothetical protein BG58_11060 [Caballeronia jiangsuensis]
MPKMKLTTTAERFFEHRLEIASWLLKHKIAVELHLSPSKQKVYLMFDNTNDAWTFAEKFEDV